MTKRVACCVPFCRRTTSADTSEWLCPNHWRIVQPSIKQAYFRTLLRMRKVLRRKPQYRRYWELPPGSPARMSAIDMWARYRSAWAKCKRDAIEGAAGIS